MVLALRLRAQLTFTISAAGLLVNKTSGRIAAVVGLATLAELCSLVRFQLSHIACERRRHEFLSKPSRIHATIYAWVVRLALVGFLSAIHDGDSTCLRYSRAMDSAQTNELILGVPTFIFAATPQKPSQPHPTSARIRGKIAWVPLSEKARFGEADEEDYFLRSSSFFARPNMVRYRSSADRSALAAVAWSVFQWHGSWRWANDVERHHEHQVENRNPRTRTFDAGNLGGPDFPNDCRRDRQTTLSSVNIRFFVNRNAGCTS
jgi:hypothetical protein